MAPSRVPSLVASLLACTGLLLAFGGGRLTAEDAPPSIVPDVAQLTLPEAAAVLAESGLNIDTYYEHHYSQGYTLGHVIQQKPRPGTLVKRGSGVQLMVMAAVHGDSAGRAPDPSWPRAQPLASPPPAAAPAAPARPPAAAPGVPRARPPGARGGSESIPLVPPSTAPEPGPLPSDTPLPSQVPTDPGSAPTEPAVPPAGFPPPLAEAVPLVPPQPPELPGLPLVSVTPSGSPDAPVVAERALPGEVPDLRGLSLNDAEQCAREAELVLYVERVPGHPVGRVVTQVPAVGQRRAKGSVVSVTVTAGGDYEGESAPAPAVDVPRVMVPDLLDRTALQAERITTDLGLVFKRELGTSGMPGRVVDQKPAAGLEVPKGSVLTLWITAEPPPSARAGSGPVGSAPVGSAPRGTSVPPGPAPALPAGAPGPAPLAGVPAPIAPSAGTLMPKQRTLMLGFSWLAVEGADAYVLEIEERTPSGWLAGVRKPARATATTVELERMATIAGEVRWRVRAILAGQEGAPCDWVTLR